MTSPWLAESGNIARGSVRSLVRDSWNRSAQSELDPERLLPPLSFEAGDLHEYRDAHPLSQVMPVIRKLLVRDADDDSGMLIAVGDAMGRLLWVEGDTGLKSRAEAMMFVEGSDWSEAAAGTSAPGTALTLDHGIQIRQDEHYNQLVHAWSCTAVPVHDPETRTIIGVLDITGGDQAVDRHTMPLMEATAHAVENELLLARLRDRENVEARSARGSRFLLFDTLPSAQRVNTARASAVRPTMQILGRDSAHISIDGVGVDLSLRHAEIMTLLAWHRSGLSAERLAELLWGSADATSRLRAEMVRLRKILDKFQPGLAPESKPYRLPSAIEVDAQHVVALLDKGAHRAALSAYKGAILPDSQAPGIQDLRTELSDHLRESLLTDASVEVLLEYAHSDEAISDIEVWQEVLRILPAKSPKRAGIVAHLEHLDQIQADQ
jgi:hypothetical protein